MEASLADALKRATLGDNPPLISNGTPPISTPGMKPSGRSSAMAARRQKFGLKLSQMDGFGGSAQDFGLNNRRPANPDPPPSRRAPPQGELGTPFSSFSKIVYVLQSPFPIIFLSSPPNRPTALHY